MCDKKNKVIKKIGGLIPTIKVHLKVNWNYLYNVWLYLVLMDLPLKGGMYVYQI